MAEFKAGDRVVFVPRLAGTKGKRPVYIVVAADYSRAWLHGYTNAFPNEDLEAASNQDAPGFQCNAPRAGAEQDPNGLDQHAPGAKVDAGKVRPSLIIEGMARAVWAVAEVGTFGAAKYTDGGWVLVVNGQQRYADAQYRHILKRAKGETVDTDSHLSHLAHEAWNALAKLDLYLREQEKVKVG